MAERGLF